MVFEELLVWPDATLPSPGQLWWTLLAGIFCLCTLQAPVVLSRDHHDVSGTDSPFRETSNIYDGSAFCAGEEDKTSKAIFFKCWIWILFKNQLIHLVCHNVTKNVLAFERWDRG